MRLAGHDSASGVGRDVGGAGGLTRDAVSALPAGRELDALVAERVMGWTRLDVRPSCWPPAVSLTCIELGPRFGTTVPPYAGPWWLPPGVTAERGPVNGVGFPEYSTDIAAAWTVLETVQRRSACLASVTKFRDGAHGCIVESNRDGERLGKETAYARADTAPLAICRTALLATLERP